MAAKTAARRLVHAESKYDQRIIGALILAFAWVAFWTVADQKAAIDAPRTVIELPAIEAPGPEPDGAAGRTLSYHFKLAPAPR